MTNESAPTPTEVSQVETDRREVLEKQAVESDKEIKEVLERHQLEFHVNLNFPIYNVMPDELMLAIKIIQKHQPQYIVGYKRKAAVQEDPNGHA